MATATLRYRRIDTNGDYIFGNGKFDFQKDIDAFVQAVKTKLQFFKGEWWEDTSAGVPFYQEIAGVMIKGDDDKDLITQVYLNVISSVFGFSETISYNDAFDYDNRKYSLTANVETIWGTTTIEV